ncbi:hypothetical protein [Haliovirga abyssi]|uniref:6-bladed beta-propeller n=1 Tax=Haliovirga abyssi TaxID=2996794 RepID=A0AAU9E1P8_9FUSO|nr:hypothetical protein [Haliovirga abyssi]BDU50310.1 hypothetical protein HLVA_08790 [Haliovirga abyssi]
MKKIIYIFIYLFISVYSFSIYEVGITYGDKPNEIIFPISFTMSKNNDTYVLDYGLSKVVLFDKKFKFIKKLDLEKGNISIKNIKDKIYLLNSIKNSITVYNLNLEKIFSFGSKGMTEKKFNHIGEIYMIKDKLYIFDEYNYRIQILDKNYNYLSQILLPKFEYIYKPYYSFNYDLSYNNGIIYILDKFNKKVYEYDVKTNKKIKKELNLAEMVSPAKMFFIKKSLVLFDKSNNNIYFPGVKTTKKVKEEGKKNNVEILNGSKIIEKDNNIFFIRESSIYKYNIQTKKEKKIIDFKKISKGEYLKPIALSEDKKNNLYVVDNSLNKVLIYDKKGSFVKEIENIGIFPTDIAIDDNNNKYISIAGENRIKKYNWKNRLIFTYGGYQEFPCNYKFWYDNLDKKEKEKKKKSEDRYIYNLKLDLDSMGYIYVLDSKEMNIKKYDNFFSEKDIIGGRESLLNIVRGKKSFDKFGWDEQNLDNLSDIFYNDNKIYVLDRFYKRIDIIENGKLTKFIEDKFSENGLNGIYVKNDKIYVTDTYNFSIKIYDNSLKRIKDVSLLQYGIMPVKIYGDYIIGISTKEALKKNYRIYNIKELLND